MENGNSGSLVRFIVIIVALLLVFCICTLCCGTLFYFASSEQTENEYTTNSYNNSDYDYDEPYYDDIQDEEITPLDDCLEEVHDEYIRVWNETCQKDGAEIDLSQTFHCTLSNESLKAPDIALDNGKHDCYIKYPEYDLSTYDECIQSAYEYYIQEWNSNCEFKGFEATGPAKNYEGTDKICELDQEEQERWDDMHARYIESCEQRKR